MSNLLPALSPASSPFRPRSPPPPPRPPPLPFRPFPSPLSFLPSAFVAAIGRSGSSDSLHASPPPPSPGLAAVLGAGGAGGVGCRFARRAAPATAPANARNCWPRAMVTRGSLPPRPPPVSEHAASHSRFQSRSGRNLKADSGGDGSLDILARKRRVHSRARVLFGKRGRDGTGPGGGYKRGCEERMEKVKSPSSFWLRGVAFAVSYYGVLYPRCRTSGAAVKTFPRQRQQQQETINVGKTRNTKKGVRRTTSRWGRPGTDNGSVVTPKGVRTALKPKTPIFPAYCCTSRNAVRFGSKQTRPGLSHLCWT